MRRPVAVDPVKAILSTAGSPARWAPAIGPSPVMTLTTPLGRSSMPSRMRHSSRAVTGVASAGLSTTVQPAARAGAIFQAAIMSG